MPVVANGRWGVYGSSLVDTSGYQYCDVAVGQVMVTRYVSEASVTRSVSTEEREAGRGGWEMVRVR